ncbi:MAG TPA: calcium-binding protein [Caulobacteraceae bacterium]
MRHSAGLQGRDFWTVAAPCDRVNGTPLPRGTAGDDSLTGTGGPDTLRGLDGDDTLNGGQSADRLEGGDGNDVIADGAGADTSVGGKGDDRFLVGDLFIDTSGGPNDNWDGGSGIDTWDISAFVLDPLDSGVFVDLASGHWSDGSVSESILNVENVNGSQGGDHIAGDEGRNRLNGGDGNDTIFGRDGPDTINGGKGDDFLVALGSANAPQMDYEAGALPGDLINGGDGNDTIYGSNAADTLSDGPGDDTIYAQGGDDWLRRTGSENGDRWDGGDGADTWDMSGWTAPAGALNISTLLADSQTAYTVGDVTVITDLLNVENVIGCKLVDFIRGTEGANRLDGFSGDDQISGGGGDDTLIGGDGSDHLLDGAGANLLQGGAGGDFLSLAWESAAGGSQTLDGGAGSDWMTSYAVNDWRIRLGAGVAAAADGSAVVTLISIENAFGGFGNDTLVGGSGRNVLGGGSGNDLVDGGGGNDIVNGNAGRDTLIGGAGADRFAFSGFGVPMNVIQDFSSAEHDKIDLSDYSGGVDYIGSHAFHGDGHAEVRVKDRANDQLVQIDTNGDGTSDYDIIVKNSGLTQGADDFILTPTGRIDLVV